MIYDCRVGIVASICKVTIPKIAEGKLKVEMSPFRLGGTRRVWHINASKARLPSEVRNRKSLKFEGTGIQISRSTANRNQGVVISPALPHVFPILEQIRSPLVFITHLAANRKPRGGLCGESI